MPYTSKPLHTKHQKLVELKTLTGNRTIRNKALVEATLGAEVDDHLE